MSGNVVSIRGGSGGLPTGDGSGHDGSMSELERRVGALEGKVDTLVDATQALRESVAEIKGKISQMPTTWQMATWFVGVSIGLVALVFAISFTIARIIK